jgi:hypothetical protein
MGAIANRRVAGDDGSHLFAPPPRWGYEYLDPGPPTECPEEGHPPVMRQARLIPFARAAGVETVMWVAGIGTVGVLLLDSLLKAFSIGEAKGAPAYATIVLVSLVAAGASFWTTRTLLEQRPRAAGDYQHTPLRGYVAPTILALLFFSVPYVLLAIEAFIAWRRRIVGANDLVPDPHDVERAHWEHEQAYAAWTRRIADFDAAEAQRHETADLWRPVPVSEAVRATCVFGGNARSWTAALTTLGASLVGSGQRVTIIDLSGRLTVDELCDRCRGASIATVEAAFPDSAAARSLFADLSWEELSSVLAEVLNAAQRDHHASQTERLEDMGVMREVADCLQHDGPVSIGRLHRALLALRTGESDEDRRCLQTQELSRLLALRTQLRRERGRTMERVTRLERALRDLARRPREPNSDWHEEPVEGLGSPQDGEPSLLVLGIDERDDALTSERLAGLLFELVARRLRLGEMETDALALLGADRIQGRKLESLLAAADASEVQAFLFFEHLRDEAIRLMGAGGAAAGFLRLGNHEEAQEASRFIGSEHLLVISNQTISAGESLAQTSGWERVRTASISFGLPATVSAGLAQSNGRSYSETFGQNVQYTLGAERVSEALVGAKELMGLPLTEMIYVEVLAGGRRKTWNVDCHPEVGSSPRARRPDASIVVIAD